MSRRSVFKGAAGVGVAAGLAVGAAAPASAAPLNSSTAVSAGQHRAPLPKESVVAHVPDAGSGTVELFVGERHIKVQHPALAEAIMHAAASAW